MRIWCEHCQRTHTLSHTAMERAMYALDHHANHELCVNRAAYDGRLSEVIDDTLAKRRLKAGRRASTKSRGLTYSAVECLTDALDEAMRKKAFSKWSKEAKAELQTVYDTLREMRDQG